MRIGATQDVITAEPLVSPVPGASPAPTEPAPRTEPASGRPRPAEHPTSMPDVEPSPRP